MGTSHPADGRERNRPIPGKPGPTQERLDHHAASRNDSHALIGDSLPSDHAGTMAMERSTVFRRNVVCARVVAHRRGTTNLVMPCATAGPGLRVYTGHPPRSSRSRQSGRRRHLQQPPLAESPIRPSSRSVDAGLIREGHVRSCHELTPRPCGRGGLGRAPRRRSPPLRPQSLASRGS